MDESYHPEQDHDQQDMPEEHTAEEPTPEEQRERLTQASQIASRWVIALGKTDDHGPNDQTLSALAEKIIALSADYQPDVSEISVKDLGFSTTTLISLQSLGIKTAEDFSSWSAVKLTRTMGSDIGSRRLEEIKSKLGTIGITLPDR